MSEQQLSTAIATIFQSDMITHPSNNAIQDLLDQANAPSHSPPSLTLPPVPPRGLQLPTPPPVTTTSSRVPLILSRQTFPPVPPAVVPTVPVPAAVPAPDDYESHTQYLSELLAEAALLEDDDEVPPVLAQPTLLVLPTAVAVVPHPVQEAAPPAARPLKKKRPKKKTGDAATKKTGDAATTTTTKTTTLDVPLPAPVAAAAAEPEEAAVSATEALKALPAQKVSITARTQVRILRHDSSVSLSQTEAAPAKVLPPERRKKAPSSHRGRTDDAKLARDAARRFNHDVRVAVEDSNPDLVYAILHDRHNHKFALDALVSTASAIALCPPPWPRPRRNAS
jgi:hypothetical protein